VGRCVVQGSRSVLANLKVGPTQHNPAPHSPRDQDLSHNGPLPRSDPVSSLGLTSRGILPRNPDRALTV
jgi:hypothetical protein